MNRPKHPKKEVESAITFVEACGWRVQLSEGHAWGRIYCPFNSVQCRGGEFCIASVWSTPRDATAHGMQIRRVVENCVLRK